MNEQLNTITRNCIQLYKEHKTQDLIAYWCLIQTKLSRWEFNGVKQKFEQWHRENQQNLASTACCDTYRDSALPKDQHLDEVK